MDALTIQLIILADTTSYADGPTRKHEHFFNFICLPLLIVNEVDQLSTVYMLACNNFFSAVSVGASIYRPCRQRVSYTIFEDCLSLEPMAIEASCQQQADR